MAAKFKFSLDSLKKLRENKLLIAKKELAVIEERIRKLENEKNLSESQRRQILEQANTNFDKPNLMQLYSDLVQSETLRMAQLEKKIIDVEIERNRHREWVTHLGRELKIVERLEEKKREEFLKEQQIREKRKADGWVAENWNRSSFSEPEGGEETT